MARSAKPEKTPSPGLIGAVSAALFNLVLVAGAVESARLLSPSPVAEETLSATQSAFSALTRDLIPDGEDRRRAWNDMVARAIAEGDRNAAHGLIAAAPDLLDGEAGRALIAARDSGDALAYRQATAALLSDANRAAAEAGGLLAGPRAAVSIIPAADPRDLAREARQLAQGRAGEAERVILTGLLLEADAAAAALNAPDQADAMRQGAGALRHALQTGALTPSFQSALSARLGAIASGEALRAAFSAADFTENDVGRIFAGLLADRPALRVVAGDLQHVAAMVSALGVADATHLLHHAEGAGDLAPLARLAQAAPETAGVVARRVEDSNAFMRAARGERPNSLPLLGPVASVFALLAAALGLTIWVVRQALARARRPRHEKLAPAAVYAAKTAATTARKPPGRMAA